MQFLENVDIGAGPATGGALAAGAEKGGQKVIGSLSGRSDQKS
jgi:hypothetical protein